MNKYAKDLVAIADVPKADKDTLKEFSVCMVKLTATADALQV